MDTYYGHQILYRNDGDGTFSDVAWQAGVAQKIDNADTTLYLVYQNSSGDVLGNAVTAAANFAPVGTTELQPFQVIVTGAKINF